MSGLPIMPALPAAAAFQREAVAQVQPAPGRGVAATAPTLTSAAVQQAPAVQKPYSLPQQVLPAPQDRRARLVGPPPAFEVNVLQDLLEARKAPPDPDMQDRDELDSGIPPEDGSDPTSQVAQSPPDYASYAALRSLATPDNAADPEMDRSV